MSKGFCAKCHFFPHGKNKRYCNICHAFYMRNWRILHKLTPEQNKLAKVRAHSRMLEERGNLRKSSCQFCGDHNSERHHPEPLNPYKVIYLCKGHHLAHHQGLIDISHLIPQDAIFKRINTIPAKTQ